MQISWSEGQLPESKLIERVIAGDSVAGEVFVSRYGRLIAYCVVRVGVLAADREDISQQVYVHLWEKNYERLKAWREDAPLSSFLFRVTSRLALNHVRQKTRHREVAMLHTSAIDEWESRGSIYPETKEFPVEAAVEVGLQRVALSRALDSLSERDIRLLLLRHWDGLSYQAIANSLGWTINHVGVALSNAECRYRKSLLADSPELFTQFPQVNAKK
ncbi:MAG: RNA polymerase sigma factor [Chitinophagaceae bacterium]|nr:MAG: RNA polymerase sigma factor [Chitinophagaceae bacterium]